MEPRSLIGFQSLLALHRFYPGFMFSLFQQADKGGIVSLDIRSCQADTFSDANRDRARGRNVFRGKIEKGLQNACQGKKVVLVSRVHVARPFLIMDGCLKQAWWE